VLVSSSELSGFIRLFNIWPASFLGHKFCSPFRDGWKRNNPHDHRYLRNRAPDSEMAFASQPGA
jgi:hypothetical protein